MQKLDLGIQIVNYKTKAFLTPLIESILKDLASSKLSYEVNILDNASGDNLDSIKQTYLDKHVHVYQAEKNKGFGAGHNYLANRTEANYLLILNPDVLFINKDTVLKLVETLESNKAAVVGPKLLTLPSSELPYSPALSNPQPQFWDHGVIGKSGFRFHANDKPTNVAWVSGAVLLIKRQIFMSVSGFNERFFLYFEEVDMCLRIRKLSYNIIYDPLIQVLHYGGVVANKRSIYGIKSFLYFRLKHPLYPWVI